MAIGLKRGTVKLAEHNPEWEIIASNTIERLRSIFGTVAKDIQHIGSTSIKGIKAKPIIDIVIAVENFAEVEKLIPTLEAQGFLKRKWETDEQLLFACGDYSKPDGEQTHFIHVVIENSVAWRDYINFRDYLNANASIGKNYEALKVRLVKENPVENSRENYLKGKHQFIQQILQDALIWRSVAECVPAIVDRQGLTFDRLELLDKGWSNDKKYVIHTIEGTKFLIRIADIDQYDRKKHEFEMIQKVADLGIAMSQPLDFGTYGENVYQFLSWVEGVEAEEALLLLNKKKQYQLGVKTGEFLRKIHSIPAPSTIEDWETRFNRKVDNKIENYRECEIRFSGDEEIISYIEKNRKLLSNRPQCLQHGDYHVGNMIISRKDTISIIDWNRFDFGDPWEEFNRIVWSAAVSPYFATGQLHGYFGGEPPVEFFKLLAFYIATNTLAAIPWAIPFGQPEIDTMIKQSQDVLRWFDNMENPVPTWYMSLNSLDNVV